MGDTWDSTSMVPYSADTVAYEGEVPIEDQGYYDEYDNWIYYEGFGDSGIPEGHVHDEQGRLMKSPADLALLVDEDDPEELELLVSAWQMQEPATVKDAAWASKVAWPNEPNTVYLKRIDVFEQQSPHLQMASTSIDHSRRIRQTKGWVAHRSIFTMDKPTSLTSSLLIETTGPPKRCKYRLKGKENERDFSTWMPQETLDVFIGADRIPGASNFYSDFRDLPDRYFISSSPEPIIGARRLYRFGAYSATQYFIMEKRVFSEVLLAEGGYGLTYTLIPGPVLTATKGWRIIGSFFGFDQQISGSSKYTVYRRNDPFPRMLVALDSILRPEEWDSSIQFYAFDVPIPGTTLYTLQHCLRSIMSSDASIPRHRLTTQYARNPWEFRMNVYVFPAALEDCSIDQGDKGRGAGGYYKDAFKNTFK
mmetsp:Transcript_15284/g.33737  ORF Transcript_15284/g.33737 Transcript_15284/m.33737 type:complete len:421 (-) Transcript_15284:53-1315(-)